MEESWIYGGLQKEINFRKSSFDTWTNRSERRLY